MDILTIEQIPFASQIKVVYSIPKRQKHGKRKAFLILGLTTSWETLHMQNMDWTISRLEQLVLLFPRRS